MYTNERPDVLGDRNEVKAQFIEACERNDLSTLQKLLAWDDNSVSLACGLGQGFLAACASGCVAVVCELLALAGGRFIDVHANQEHALRNACFGGHIAVIEELLALDGDRRVNVHAVSEGALRTACGAGQLRAVRLLLGLQGDRRADVHAAHEGAFWAACSEGHLSVVQLLLTLEGDRRVNVHAKAEEAFRDACWGGHTQVVHLLLSLDSDRCIDVHAEDEGALTGACYAGHTHVVKLLLGLQGDRRVDVQTDNCAALRDACSQGHVDVAKLLLSLDGDRRMDVHAGDDGPLRAACLGGHVEIVCELLAVAPQLGHAYTWEHPYSGNSLRECFAQSLASTADQGRNVAVAILRGAGDLPSQWLQLFNALCSACGYFTFISPPLPAVHLPQHAPLMREALLHALQAQHTGGAAGSAALLTGGRVPAADAIALGAALSCSLFVELLQVLPSEIEVHASRSPLVYVLAQYRRGVAWAGVEMVPTPVAASGIRDGGTRRALGRVARGGMVLHRIRSRTYSKQLP